MKVHTTNYVNTFIEIAEDCPTALAETPPVKGDTPSVANIQFDMIRQNPYKYTSDEVVFQVFATKKDLTESEWDMAWTAFFSKGQACLRCSPLGKRYGWGIHHNEESKVALVAADSAAYQQFSTAENVKRMKAMRSKKG